jgi:hypothetical protein
MNENPILPARIYIFFPPLFYPKIFHPLTYHLPPPSYLPSTSPLLPTTYQPLPPLIPLPELQRCRAGVSLEQGSLEGSLEQRAWSKGAAGAEARPK